MWQWKIARYSHQRTGIFISAGQGNGSKKRLGIGVLHFVEDIFDAAGLNRLA